MEAVSKLVGGRLHWVQPQRFERWFELRAEEQLVATLGWETSCGTLARGECNDGSWTFKRIGFLNPRVTIRQSGSEVDLAVFWPRWLGDGTLEFAYGKIFRWQSTNFWGTRWMFADSDGTPLITLEHGSGKGGLSEWFKTQAIIDIHAQAQDVRDLPLLVLVGWYLMILRQDDAAAGAAAASAAAS